VRAFQAAAAYDHLRLSTYCARESERGRVRIEQVDDALLLQFDDVGYFNRVYAQSDAIAGQLDQVERFYRDSPFGCELVFARDDESLLSEACARRGWLPGHSYAWMHVKTSAAEASDEYAGISIRQPRVEEHMAFLEFYLRGFEAPPANVSAAVRNMRHLFDLPQLHFRIASREGIDAAIGMLCVSGDTAMLAAGATLPEQRRHGCHHAVLADRIRLAHRLGCTDIVSYAYEGGQSHFNMESMGLETVNVTQGWRFQGAAAS
jgi:hypothetical protein